MKYKSNDSVQNCIPGGVEQQIQQIAPPVDMKVDEVPKLFISLSCENHKKNVTTKTCTCSGGMVPCPIHEGTNRSSINGYTQNTTSTMNLKATSNTSKDEMTKKHLPLQRCKENGKILNKTKHDDDVLVEANDFEGNALLSSRTIIIESSKCSHLSNNKNCDSSNEQHPSANFNLDELKLSLTSLVSNDTTITDTEKQATESYQNWLSKKKRQEREIRQRESHLKKLIEQEKQKKIQMEQENFLNWLHCKKEKEKQEKEIRKKALMEEQRRNKEKLKREEINKKQYQLWLKLKKEQDLIKKLHEQKKKIEKEEMDRLQLERNQSAFQEWLIYSKDKPKPVPLNQGLESLRASTSVSFVNPIPWVPNIVKKTKLSSK